MKMYRDKYKNGNNGKKVKEKENKLNINQDKTKENTQYIPFLVKSKDEKQRVFIPNYSLDGKQIKKDFTLFLEIPKEKKNRSFTPDYSPNIMKKQREFTPFPEMPKKKERDFIPDYGLKNSKKPHEKRVHSSKAKKEIHIENLLDEKSQNKFKEYDKGEVILSHLGPTDGIPLKYPTLKFLEDIKDELKNLDPKLMWAGDIPLSTLSKLFGKYRSWLRDNINRNPDYKIALNLIMNFENKMLEKYSEKHGDIINFIKKYREENILPKLDQKIFYYHPEIRLDYFKKIDTKEKAYWLGFIYADGSIYSINPKEDADRFGLDLARKDKILIIRFAEEIKFNPKFFNDYDRKRFRDGKYRIGKLTRLEFRSKEFIDHLKKLGVVPNKTSCIELPNLGSREFNIAFLLGFYDGDGRMGTTNLRSSNSKFLGQIKKKYNLPYEVSPDKDNSHAYYLSLGAELFNEMMRTYEKSLPRKRKIFSLNKYKTQELTKEVLEKLVWEEPKFVIARLHSLSQSTITRLCNKYHIEAPSSYYWTNKNYLDKEKMVSFYEFLEFYKVNPNKDLDFYYRHFPYNAPSQIRKWSYKVK